MPEPKIASPCPQTSHRTPRVPPRHDVRNIFQALRLADDLRVAFEAIAPHLVTDDHYWMGIVAYVLAGFEAAPENRTNPDRFEIVGGNNAAGRNFGAASEIQRAGGNRRDKGVFAQRAVPAQVEEVRPGKEVRVTLALYGSENCEQPVLMCNQR